MHPVYLQHGLFLIGVLQAITYRACCVQQADVHGCRLVHAAACCCPRSNTGNSGESSHTAQLQQTATWFVPWLVVSHSRHWAAAFGLWDRCFIAPHSHPTTTLNERIVPSPWLCKRAVPSPTSPEPGEWRTGTTWGAEAAFCPQPSHQPQFLVLYLIVAMHPPTNFHLQIP